MIGPRQLGLLAAVGLGRVPTAPRPRVVVMSTGTELVEPGRPLGRDSIYDANSYLLAAAVRAARRRSPTASSATSDDPAEFAEALSDQLVRADLVVTSGGVSKGTHDVVKEVLAELGTVDFLEVAMQPGKPQGFGVVGEDATPIFTLPGNPVSAYVSFEMFVVPALHRLIGRARRVRAADHGAPSPSRCARSAGEQQLRPRRGRRSTPTASRVTPVGGARLAPDRRPRPGRRADRARRGRHPRRPGRRRCRCCCWTGP